MTNKHWIAVVLVTLAAAAAAHLAFRSGGEVAPLPAPAATTTAPGAATMTAASGTATVAVKPASDAAPAATSSRPLVGRRQFFAGPITEVTPTGFKVLVGKGVIRDITIGNDTQVRRYNDAGTAMEPMPISDLVPDLRVRVFGSSLADGGTLAATVTTGHSASAGTSAGGQEVTL